MHPNYFIEYLNTTIMKKTLFLLVSMIMIVAFSSCKKKPMYVYIDNEADKPKVSEIMSENDDDAYFECFRKYSEARHYPGFSEVEKSKAIISDNIEACESDEGDQGMAPAPDSSISGDVIPTDDSDNLGEYQNPGLDVNIEPNFKLYKITDKDAQKVAKDLISNKISFEEFEKEIKGKSEEIDLYKKDFKKCEQIFNEVYDKMKSDFIKREQAAKQKKQQ